jgi:hypothetical protein
LAVVERRRVRGDLAVLLVRDRPAALRVARGLAAFFRAEPRGDLADLAGARRAVLLAAAVRLPVALARRLGAFLATFFFVCFRVDFLANDPILCRKSSLHVLLTIRWRVAP